MDADGSELRTRLISADPMVMVVQQDYGISHARPLHVHLRSGPSFPMTYLNLHPGLELGIMLSGQEERLFSDLTLPVREGDVWLAAMWERHGTKRHNTEARVLVLTFLPEYLGEAALLGGSWLDLFAVPPAQRPRVTDERMRAKTLALAEEIWEESEQRALGWEEAVRLHLLQVLLTLRRGWQPVNPRVALLDRTSALQRLLPVLAADYVDPLEHTSVDEAAAACDLSRRHFTRLFRQTMGLSFAQFRLRTRGETSAALLRSTDLRVDVIAERAGFADASHFHHAFVKQYACTPGEYRRRFRQSAGDSG